MYLRAHTKKCPQCRLEIAKDEGCAHMVCSQCAHHFCWLCLGDYATHSDQTGGFYACNKFEARVRAEGRTEDERVALQVPCFRLCISFFLKRKLRGKTTRKTTSRQTREPCFCLCSLRHLCFSRSLSQKGSPRTRRAAPQAARALKCYEMAFERHLNHTQALDAAERELLSRVEAKVADMAAAAGKASASASAGAGAASSNSSSGVS
jgi:hypothetical protein